MSYEKQPSPVLPIYNPSSWETPLSAEEQEILNAYYVKYPTAQNAPITFPSNITINGTTKTNKVDASAYNSAQTIGSNVTTGSVGVGTALTTGTVAIGPGGGNGLGNGGNVSIASGTTHVAGSYMSLGSDALPYSYIRAINIELNTNSATNTNIGHVNGQLNIFTPIRVGYTPSTLTSNTMIGYTVEDSITATNIVNATNYNAFITNVTLPAGVWLISYSFKITGSASITMTELYSAGLDSANGDAKAYAQNINGATVTSTLFGTSGTFAVSSTGTTGYNIRIFSRFSGGTLTVDNSSVTFKSLIRRTRIA